MLARYPLAFAFVSPAGFCVLPAYRSAQLSVHRTAVLEAPHRYARRGPSAPPTHHADVSAPIVQKLPLAFRFEYSAAAQASKSVLASPTKLPPHFQESGLKHADQPTAKSYSGFVAHAVLPFDRCSFQARLPFCDEKQMAPRRCEGCFTEMRKCVEVCQGQGRMHADTKAAVRPGALSYPPMGGPGRAAPHGAGRVPNAHRRAKERGTGEPEPALPRLREKTRNGRRRRLPRRRRTAPLAAGCGRCRR